MCVVGHNTHTDTRRIYSWNAKTCDDDDDNQRVGQCKNWRRQIIKQKCKVVTLKTWVVEFDGECECDDRQPSKECDEHTIHTPHNNAQVTWPKKQGKQMKRTKQKKKH